MCIIIHGYWSSPDDRKSMGGQQESFRDILHGSCQNPLKDMREGVNVRRRLQLSPLAGGEATGRMSWQQRSGAGREACGGNWALLRETQAAAGLLGSAEESGSQRVACCGAGSGLVHFEEGNEVDHEVETTQLPQGRWGWGAVGSRRSESPSAGHHSLINYSLGKKPLTVLQRPHASGTAG